MKNSMIFLVVAGLIFSTHSSCQKTEIQMLIELSEESAYGMDGFEYVLTKNEFLTPYDLPIQQVKAKFGEKSTIADWNDLKENFGNDLSGFLQGIGLLNYEMHEGFFITKDKKYMHMMKRPYMLIGKNNQQYSAWLIEKNLKDSKLIIANQFESARVLLKIPSIQ